eukprot:7388817-Prymnesium_polylepis.2
MMIEEVEFVQLKWKRYIAAVDRTKVASSARTSGCPPVRKSKSSGRRAPLLELLEPPLGAQAALAHVTRA